jgi:hypothetical protein
MKDFCLEKNSVFLNDEADLILQQIDLLFDTHENEVLGENIGSKFEDFLWDMTVSAEEISSYTENLIMGNVNLMGWSVDVHTDLMLGTQNDIILITIKIYNEFTSFEKTYTIE